MFHLVVFAHMRWDFIVHRPQQLLSRLAKHYRVLYVEEPMCRPGPARFDRRNVAPNVEVLRPCTPLADKGFHNSQLALLGPLLRQHLKEHRIHDYAAVLLTPLAQPVLPHLEPRSVVYDCMEAWADLPGAPVRVRQLESALLKSADVVFTSGPSLYAAKREQHPNVVCLPSAVDEHHYSLQSATTNVRAMEHAEVLQGRLCRPRLGYFGVIDSRLDLNLLTALADADPLWQIIMVGPESRADPIDLPYRPNIHWLGPQPYSLLPQIAAGWDVCLVPFVVNESTRYLNPTKTLEYMAAEKPVVSTALPDVVSMYGDVVRIADSTGSFIKACADELSQSGYKRSEHIGRILSSVSRFSWDKTAESARNAIEKTLKTKAAMTRRPQSKVEAGSSLATC